MTEEIRKIDKSLLAPWQKVDAVNTFVIPQADFHLRNGQVEKKKLRKFDQELKVMAKKWLNLPNRASSEIIYLSYKEGGLNFLPSTIMADIAMATHAARLLTSKDQVVVDHCITSLSEVVKKKLLLREPEVEEIIKFVNSSNEGELGKRSNDISSTWSRVRAAMRRLKSK
ncbi:MAG: hypothetical protein PV362_10700, partial [Providencia heimbachae]|nr:hypothetical protein [Providencia heimbachae]